MSDHQRRTIDQDVPPKETSGAQNGEDTPMKYTWSTERGPYYRCDDEDHQRVLDVHQDLSTSSWRVSYPDGRSNLHSGIDGARQEAELHMASLGDDRALSFIVQ